MTMSEVSSQRSYNMSRIRSKNTTPERIVRNELWHKGYRYRLNDKRLPGTPDLVLPKYRAVIFINGCFWHGHRGCPKYVAPKTNAQFWKEKIASNIARDELNAQRLDTLAWTVITVWECELSKKADLSATIARIEADLQAARTKYEHYLSIRRENREFARKQAQKHREILAQVEAELNLPKSLRRYAKKAQEEE
jgi:DNA mismatch endonuclease (patch repair protein)